MRDLTPKIVCYLDVKTYKVLSSLYKGRQRSLNRKKSGKLHVHLYNTRLCFILQSRCFINKKDRRSFSVTIFFIYETLFYRFFPIFVLVLIFLVLVFLWLRIYDIIVFP